MSLHHVVGIVAAADARRVAAHLRKALGRSPTPCRILASAPDATGRIIELAIRPGDFNSAQAYRLTVSARRAHLAAASQAGLWYGVQTLIQLARGRGAIPCVEVDDEPDFPVRGVMLDISRDKVPTMRTLYRLVDWLASLKINQLQLYTEHTFAYARHRDVWKDASPMTPREIRSLDRYCRDRFIELVPNQNCFGHMERWLKHRRYSALAEATGPWRDPWGKTRNTRTTLNPLDPRSLRLVTGLLDELLPHFTSRTVNVGCDETWELGQGRSAEACRARGIGRVYLEYLLKLHEHVQRHGHQMQFWADIIHRHPHLIPELPRDAVPLEWGYEADHPFDARCRALASAGLKFYVCPGTSSWCSISGRTNNALLNLANAAQAGIRHGAHGYLITDWGDGGHRQYQSVSYIPLLYGASVSWAFEANRYIDIAAAASALAFDDPRGQAGQCWFEIGNLYEDTGVSLKNQTIYFQCGQMPLDECLRAAADPESPISRADVGALARLFARATAMATRYVKLLAPSREADICCHEFLATLDNLTNAAGRLLAVKTYAKNNMSALDWSDLALWTRMAMKGHAGTWRLRNRPGGLRDSLAHFERNLAEYVHMHRQDAESPGRQTRTRSRAVSVARRGRSTAAPSP